MCFKGSNSGSGCDCVRLLIEAAWLGLDVALQSLLQGHFCLIAGVRLVAE